MSAYIGDVNFDDPLQWVTKPNRVSLGKNIRTRSGNLVQQRGVSTSQAYIEHKALFTWVPMSDVDRLKELAASGNAFTADLEDTGSTVTIRFVPGENAVTNVKHSEWGEAIVHDQVEGYPTDIYDGELNFVIEA